MKIKLASALLLTCLVSFGHTAYPWKSFDQSYTAVIGNTSVTFGYKEESISRLRMMVKYVGPDVAKNPPSNQPTNVVGNVGCIIIALEPKVLTPADGSWEGADIIFIQVPTFEAMTLGYDPKLQIYDSSIMSGTGFGPGMVWFFGNNKPAADGSMSMET